MFNKVPTQRNHGNTTTWTNLCNFASTVSAIAVFDAGQISITDTTEVTQFMNFNDALNYCRNTLQKDMISFHSAADFAAVESQLSNANQAFWIGCTNPVQDASNNIQNWVWTDGHIFGIIQYQDQLEHIVVK